MSRPTTKERGSKTESRSKLLNAAEAIIRKEGAGAVTTVKVTKKAGFAQSAFYLHFKNVDDCLRCAGERIADKIRTSVARERRRMQQEALGEFEAEFQFHLFILKIFDDHGVATILLKNRHDPTPLGTVLGELMTGLRDDLTQDLWTIAASLGIAKKHRPRVAILADFLLANSLAAGEALVEGRESDRDLLASQLTMTMKAACHDLFHFCKEP